MTDLNSLMKRENGTFLADAVGINDQGQIIANAATVIRSRFLQCPNRKRMQCC